MAVQVDGRSGGDVRRAEAAPVAVRRERHAPGRAADHERTPRPCRADGERERGVAVDVRRRAGVGNGRRGKFRARRVVAPPVRGVGDVRRVARARPDSRRRPSCIRRREGREALRRVLHPARARERGALREVVRFKLVGVDDAVRAVEERALAVRLDDGHEVAHDHAGVLHQKGVEGVLRAARDGPRAEHGEVENRVWREVHAVFAMRVAAVHPHDRAVQQLDAGRLGHVRRRIKVRAAAVPPVVVPLGGEEEVGAVPPLAEQARVVAVRQSTDAEVERRRDVGDVACADGLPAG